MDDALNINLSDIWWGVVGNKIQEAHFTTIISAYSPTWFAVSSIFLLFGLTIIDNLFIWKKMRE